jgi:hypothetical protein
MIADRVRMKTTMMKKLKPGLALALAIFAAQLAPQAPRNSAANDSLEWRSYGGGPENTHYSTLRQINRSNVNQLQVAWIYDTGDVFDGSEMQCNPIVVGCCSMRLRRNCASSRWMRRLAKSVGVSTPTKAGGQWEKRAIAA